MSGLVKRKFFERFIADGTYTIPNGVTVLWIECIGAGGSGGGGKGHWASGGAYSPGGPQATQYDAQAGTANTGGGGGGGDDAGVGGSGIVVVRNQAS